MTDKEVVKYDPKVWNEYPKVIPPKEGWYRVQYEVECIGYVRRVVYWNGKEWETHHSFVERFAFGFKPWDDDCGCFQNGKDHSVCLTLKEAKLVQGGIRLLALSSNIYLEGGLTKMLQELLDNVDKQIEQAEKGNETK